jgi:hypothetical protein
MAIDLTEAQQREILATRSSWIPLPDAPLGEGGGARVFKVVSRTRAFLVHQQAVALTRATGQGEQEKASSTFLEFLSSLSAAAETVVAAAKVTKRDRGSARRSTPKPDQNAESRYGREPELVRHADHDCWHAQRSN